MRKDKVIHRSTNPRRRGSVYIMVLGASLLVAVIGISSLMAARVQRRAAVASGDMIQARENARAAIDRALWGIEAMPTTWRSSFAGGSFSTGTLGGGTLTLTVVDPVDGDPTNNTTDPVALTGTGVVGQATYMLEVTLNGDGTMQPGTWKRVVGDAAAQAAQATQGAQGGAKVK